MEGPSLVILKEELTPFLGKKVIEVNGNTKENVTSLVNKKLTSINTYGKHLLLQFGMVWIKIHFLLFGSYRINETKGEMIPRLSLSFKDDELNFYSCSVKFLEKHPEEIYDWRYDTMSEEWDDKTVLKTINKADEVMVCDLLLNQDIFAGVGNIIKNEVLFNLHLHPEAIISDLSLKQRKALIYETRSYCKQFYKWKKNYDLKKNWKIYKKKICPRCNVPINIRPTGKGQRKTYHCSLCQLKYIQN